MQFFLLAYDGLDPEAPNRRASARPSHIELSNKLRDEGRLLYAAAILNDSKQMIGSTMIFDFETREALDECLSKEPYVTGRVWEKIEIKPCQVGPSFLK